VTLGSQPAINALHELGQRGKEIMVYVQPS